MGHVAYLARFGNETFGPGNSIPHAQVTAIVNRMLRRSADESYVMPT